MDLLCRVTSFHNKKEAIYFFNSLIKERDEKYFYAKKEYRKIETGDKIYFIYNNYIVAKAIFTGVRQTNTSRDDEYIYGHKLKKIKLITSEKKINTKKYIFHDMKYIDTVELHNEIKFLIDEKMKMVGSDQITKNNSSLSKLIEEEQNEINIALKDSSQARNERLKSYTPYPKKIKVSCRIFCE